MRARTALLAAAAGILGAQAAPPAPEGWELERRVRLTLTDVLDRRREIHRREILRLRGPDLAVEDLTFGERLIVRPGLRRVWKADPLAGTYSELSFEEVDAHRRRALEELRAVRARVPGTAEEKELGVLLESLGGGEGGAKVEVRSDGARREVLCGGRRIASVEVDARIPAEGWVGALAVVGAFPPAVAEALRGLGGLPVKGSLRYVLFLDRVHEVFETTASRACGIPEAAFGLPPGLRRVPLEGLEPPPERRPSPPAAFRNDFREDDLDGKTLPLREKLRKP